MIYKLLSRTGIRKLVNIKERTLVKFHLEKMSSQAKNLIAICQMCATNDKESNLNQVKEIVSLSKERHAKVIN